jgi:hypothetical protein
MKNPAQRRLDLFPEVVLPVVTYNSLSIHEKINYRANTCGFERTVYRSRYNYFHHPLIRFRADSLSKEYFIHYNLNAGGRNRLDTYLKEKLKGKTLF